MSRDTGPIVVRPTAARDFAGIIEMTQQVYPAAKPWKIEQLASHVQVFPEGQLVAVDEDTQYIVGMAASLIIRWDDYDTYANWPAFTDHGMFTNHDPERGRTLYGAEVMVRPGQQGRGIGSKLYVARRELVERLGLLRIRAAARLRGYHRYANQLTIERYVEKVVRGELKDPTLSFQLKHGFEVIEVVYEYLRNDPESLGNAAVIEWLNRRVAKPEDYASRNPRFLRNP